jgi:AraC-like DNA-binding protein
MSSRLLTVADWEKLASDAAFKPETMASLCSVTLRQLERFFKLQFGRTPAAWMRDLRCRKAAVLLESGYSTKAAAKELDFASPSHFCHEFKKVYGVSPQSFAPGVGGG